MTQEKSPSACGIMILAAGLGKRMKSSLPKVLHEIGGRPLIHHVLKRVQEAVPHASVGIVVGYGKDQVEAYLKKEFQDLDLHFVLQDQQLGTGHAARCAMDSPWGETLVQKKAPILVLPGDQPLITTALISQLFQRSYENAAVQLLTCEFQDPTGYGRVLKDSSQNVVGIIEEKDATDAQKQIKEVANSIYLFKSEFLKVSLQKITNHNAQKEYYLTDLVGRAVTENKGVSVLPWAHSEDVKGINDPWELAQVDAILNQRRIKSWALQGVRFVDPGSTRIEADVILAEEVIVHEGVTLKGRTQVGKGSRIGPRCVLEDVILGEQVHFKVGTVAEKSKVESFASVGPYAHLRPDSHVGAHAKIGNFVELKKTQIGEHSSVAHLSYLGDAQVGKNVNIGCGFVTCNYDGRVIHGQRKHKTIIEDDVFLGSDCQTVAPVKVGRGAFIASGSTITEDVEADALAIARSRQVTKPGYAKKLRQK